MYHEPDMEGKKTGGHNIGASQVGNIDMVDDASDGQEAKVGQGNKIPLEVSKEKAEPDDWYDIISQSWRRGNLWMPLRESTLKIQLCLLDVEKFVLVLE